MTPQMRTKRMIAAHRRRCKIVGEYAAMTELCEMLAVSPITVSQWLAPAGYRPIPARKLAKVEAAWAA